VLPLVFAAGAAAGSMRAIGTALLGGMVTGTVLVLLFTPLFYVIVEHIFGKDKIAPASIDKKTLGNY
jgi:multidrug efflux pump subunit AcrB